MKIDFDALSDGEKSLISVISDLPRRLAILNLGMKDPLDGDGIIIIDEIDFHLILNGSRRSSAIF